MTASPADGKTISHGDYIYHVSHTVVTSEGTNILVKKQDKNGTNSWQNVYSNSGTTYDFGIDVVVDGSDNVYVLGAIESTGSNTYEAILIKYNSSGTQQWYYTYHSSGFNDDIPIALAVDASGNSYLTGKSGQHEGLCDAFTIKVNSSGTQEWAHSYDYDSGNDVGIFVSYNSSSFNIEVLAITENNTQTEVELSKLTLNAVGSLVGSDRSSIGKVADIQSVIPTSSGGYICGGFTVNLNGDRDMAIYKFASNMSTSWTYAHDQAANDDEILALDEDGSGNIYATGYVGQQPYEQTMATVKLNSSGTLQWLNLYDYPIHYNAKGYCIDHDNNQLLISGNIKQRNGEKDLIIWFIDESGNLEWRQEWKNDGADDKPRFCKQVGTEELLVSGISINNNDFTIKYDLFFQDTTIVEDTVYDNGDTISFSYMDKEVILAFDKKILNEAAINNTGKIFGSLSDFMSGDYDDTVDAAIGNIVDIDKIKVVKVFPDFTCNDTTVITVNGDTISIPPFWAVLNFHLDESGLADSVAETADSLMARITDYVFLNGLVNLVPNWEPNDPAYYNDEQPALLKPYQDPVGINATNAWKYERGHPDIKVGVFGTGVDWQHDDFRISGSCGSEDLNDYKINGGYDDREELEIEKSSKDYNGDDGHETAIAGIIGALSNNGKGVTGVAGGDGSGNNGVSLYSYVLARNGATTIVKMADWARIIPYSWKGSDKLHAMCHAYSNNQKTERGGINRTSYYYTRGFLAVQDQWWAAARAGVITVSSSANVNDATEYTHDYPSLPSTFFAPGIIRVGASEYDGNDLVRASFSCYDNYLDLMAPGKTAHHKVLKPGNAYFYEADGDPATFDGTSFSAPYVTGTAALILSSWKRNKDHSLSVGSDKLYPEDVEWLLQQSAADMQYELTEPYEEEATTGYDKYTGWGQLDAGKALWMSQRNNFAIFHYESEVSVDLNNPVAEDKKLTVLQDYAEMQKDLKFKVDVYKVSTTITAPWPQGFELVTTSSSNVSVRENGYWPLHTVCELWGYDATNEEFWPYTGLKFTSAPQKVNIGGEYKIQASLEGYVFYVRKRSPSAFKVERYVPFDFTESGAKAKLAFSAYFTRGWHVGTPNMVDSADMAVFPNPANNVLMVQNANANNHFEQVSLYDLQGKLIKQFDVAPNNHQLQLDTQGIKPGMYLLKSNSRFGQIAKKIVKR
ncbi:MAG: S8 family peptidase [Bacteroidetes bacterium]|nr:S8 family peptidase [Bacteroidota bacterium]